QIAMMIFTGWRLNRVFRRSTVKLAMIMLWVVGPIWNILTLVAIGITAGGNPFADPATLMAIAPSAAYALVWTLYLNFSQRVANTYDEEGPEVQAEAELANVF